jgi:CheY-like chemotaxis protein
MKCPKCKASVTSAPDASGLIICSKCGARLRSRTASETVIASASAVPRPGSQTLPALARPGAETLPPMGSANRKAEGPAAAPVTEAEPTEEPPAAPTPPPAAASGLEGLFDELRAVRVAQDEILVLLRERLAGGGSPRLGDDAMGSDDTIPPLPTPAVRTRRRKTVLLIDDDPSSRIAALQALELAEVPTRTAQDGSAGLAAIAQEKPDVIVLELGVDGAMSGKDVVNMVKATMEWVDVPIVLYTRIPIESQKEARTIHGADELVAKGPDGPALLVARVIGLFRKG